MPGASLSSQPAYVVDGGFQDLNNELGELLWYSGTIDPDQEELTVGVGSVPLLVDGYQHVLVRREGPALDFCLHYKVGANDQLASTGSWYWAFGYSSPRANHPFVVPALAWDASADLWYSGAAYCGHVTAYAELTQLVVTAVFGSGVGQVGESVPFTWAEDDRLLIGNAVEAFRN